MTDIKTAEDMEYVLSLMDAEQHQHLRALISTVIRCYVDDDLHGLVLIGRGADDPLIMMAVNATEMHAAQLLTSANEYMHHVTMEDAPPKEKFN
jgi:hypothetical protein